MNVFKVIRYSVSIFLCFLALILCFFMIVDNGYYYDLPGYKSYGGDAYTDIQNGISDAAWNVSRVGNTLEFVSDILGGIGAIVFIMLLLKNVQSLIGAIGELKADSDKKRQKAQEEMMAKANYAAYGNPAYAAPAYNAPTEPAAPSQSAAASQFCVNCGTSLGDDELFCHNCGAKRL